MTTDTPPEQLPRAQRMWLLRALHDETVGGILLATSALVALAWANSPWHAAYSAIVEAEFSVGPVHLDVHGWAADGLLAVLFFVVGIELKHEFTIGSLASLRQAVVPVAAALGGMVTAGTLFVSLAPAGERGAWGIPISTDVAFALAVLALAGRRLPVEMRVFLLTVAVVNDMGAIAVIAVFYGAAIDPVYAVATALCIAGIAWLQHGVAPGALRRAPIVLPIAYLVLVVGAWYSCLLLGVHPTVAGALMGFAMRIRARDGEDRAPGDVALERLRPLSAGLCVPAFAFTAAGLHLAGTSAAEVASDRLFLSVVAGLVIGQPLGVLAGAFAATRLRGVRLNPVLSWWDVAAVGCLAGVGFTVALLVAGVRFDGDPERLAVATAGVLAANVCAIAVATVVLRLRSRALAR